MKFDTVYNKLSYTSSKVQHFATKNPLYDMFSPK